MTPKIFIETPRLILRQWKESDNEPFIELNQDKEVMEFFPSVTSRELTMMQIERIAGLIDENGYGFFAVERKDNGLFIGFIGLAQPGFETHFTPCVEIGWRLSRENWGLGFATEGAKACLDFGFKVLKLNEIYSFTSIHNIRSEQVMRKIGMIKQGYFDHPLIEDGNSLKPHVLYRKNRA